MDFNLNDKYSYSVTKAALFFMFSSIKKKMNLTRPNQLKRPYQLKFKVTFLNQHKLSRKIIQIHRRIRMYPWKYSGSSWVGKFSADSKYFISFIKVSSAQKDAFSVTWGMRNYQNQKFGQSKKSYRKNGYQ